jgi:hypothetical protein
VKILVKTLQGLEGVLHDEIVALGGTNVRNRKRAVETEGNLEFL